MAVCGGQDGRFAAIALAKRWVRGMRPAVPGAGGKCADERTIGTRAAGRI